MKDLINEFRKTVVFFGIIDKKDNVRFTATGFLVDIQGIFHLVTAKHVIYSVESNEFKDQGLYVFYNRKDGTIGNKPIDQVKKTFNANWVFHTNTNVDIAIIPFPINVNTDDLKVVQDKRFTKTDQLYELYDIFFLSYQPGIQLQAQAKISPIVRTGIISLINQDETFYIDAAAFPGNSGSPVFLKPTPIKLVQHTASLGPDPLGGNFVGVIGSYIPYQEIAISQQTGMPRVIFEENTGLSKVWSVKYIEEILQSQAFTTQIGKMKQQVANQGGK